MKSPHEKGKKEKGREGGGNGIQEEPKVAPERMGYRGKYLDPDLGAFIRPR
jgi:hypothetical protein